MPHSAADAAIVGALVFAWGMLSARLERFDVTAPIIFVAAGLLLTHGPLAPLHIAPSHELVKTLAEVTLALVLFSDASRVGLHELRADLGLYVRLLGVALPLTIGLGTLLALFAIGNGGGWIALLVGAALAPTDAALGAGMMANPAVPARIRRLINVESGLNDGIATPFVSVALAGAAGNIAGAGPVTAVRGLALGLLTGVAVGAVGGCVVRITRDRGWAAEGFAGTAVLGLAVCAYSCALAAGGNGFIAAFTAGLAFGTAGGQRGLPLVPFVEETGALVSLLVWLAFGAVAVVPALQGLTWQVVTYSVLSLTVIRMLPVTISLTGAHLGWPTVLFAGWFGPRGLASVVFALLALEELPARESGPVVTLISVTVLLSIVAHGVTAEPLTRRYAAQLSSGEDAAGDRGLGIPERRLIRRGVPAPRAGRDAV
jgi:NhaP-type Na+/H+ or K+/H+ antiporter